MHGPLYPLYRPLYRSGNFQIEKMGDKVDDKVGLLRQSAELRV